MIKLITAMIMLRSWPQKITCQMPFLRFDIFICNVNIYGIFCRLDIRTFLNLKTEHLLALHIHTKKKSGLFTALDNGIFECL